MLEKIKRIEEKLEELQPSCDKPGNTVCNNCPNFLKCEAYWDIIMLLHDIENNYRDF